ncbi:MAG: cobyrinate a,c-diamide synthase [Roseibium sp.]|uniref:cobyrinate a,c-diamide synthase n=1 Tax=Roseibium sp. TaxID=1936156 RepID=UPI002623717B|nr:cobyrinate a,c-diamide synthase [Roseibium sp.]MCV0425835.1 cobyrinate a,c-diamide synthase [Roseibium sp.]
MPASRIAQTAARGALIAAPSSGAGKTTTTLSLLRALKNSGRSVASAKSGPDYIDPKFHEAATGHPCINLDAWAMDRQTLRSLVTNQASGHDYFLVEGAMGLFDGAANGKGAAAELAATLNLPVVLVVDCARQAQSIAALVHGFQSYRADVSITGVIFNRVGSSRHESMLRRALEPMQVKVLGALPRLKELTLPERHLGLVQAGEHQDLEEFLEQAAAICADHIDLQLLEKTTSDVSAIDSADRSLPVPLGQKIAIARDVAFAFSYPHLLDFWQTQGAELSFFSPLANEGPVKESDAVFLPGGYPELYAGKLASAEHFGTGLRNAARAGKLIYGECGGYMTLGTGLIDASGERHEMLGLLPLETSFETRKRHLGYRKLQPLGGLPWTGKIAAHEFHYASIVSEGDATRLFKAEDAEGNVLPDMGLQQGTVMGSFAHVISCAE